MTPAQVNVHLYISDDNRTYRPIPCRYRDPAGQPYRFVLDRIDAAGRYFKIHSTIKDTDDSQFSAGSDYGGVRVLQKP